MMNGRPDTVDKEPKAPMPVAAGLGVISALWRHKLLFLGIFLTFPVLAAIAAFVLPARYQASASVIVAEADPATRISDVWAQKQGDPADLESQIMILRSARLLKLALAQPGAYEAAIAECRKGGEKCAELKVDDPKLAESVAEHFSISAVGRSRVLAVVYTSTLPETAMTMANALVTAYLDDQRGSQSNSREVAAKWLWQEIADLDGEIRDRVTKIESFRRQNGLVQGATASISSESLTSVSQQLAAAEQTKAQAQARLDAIRDIKNGADITASPMALENRTVGDLKQQIAAIGNQLAASSTVLGPRHPQRRMLEASMGVLQKQLLAEIDRIAASAQKDYETAANLVNSLQEQVGKAKDNAANALSDESSIEGMVRDVEAKRQLYTQLYQRASELESERRSLNGGARLVSLAEVPTKPFFPKKTPMIAAGLVLGLFFGAAGCVLWDRFSGFVPLSVRPRAPVRLFARAARQRPELGLIGVLPELPLSGLGERSDQNLMAAARRSLLASSFQQPVQQLASELLERYDGRPLLFLSGERRSRSAAFSSLLIGQVLCKTGLNVLLIECAPSSREFATAFALPSGQPTLGDLLSGYAEPEDCVSSTAIPGLHVVAAGPGDDALLAEGALDGLERLVDWANPYDMIILSGPALKARGAEALLGTLGGLLQPGAILCLAPDANVQAELGEADALFARLNLNAAGAILVPQLGARTLPADPFARQRRRAG